MYCFIINVKVAVVLLWGKVRIRENFSLDEIKTGIILELFLNFSNFEQHYSYRLYSYKKVCIA